MQYGELETPLSFSQYEHDGSVEYDIYDGFCNADDVDAIEDLEIPF